MQLKLQKQWELGGRVGRGGFGQVFRATSSDGDEAVVKLVPKVPGAERELLFVDLSDVRNVVPIIDSGETADAWVLVMPYAEKSLRQHLEANNGVLTADDTVAVLSDVTTALVDLADQVVHRDVKPENILLLNGAWCLADFGISRYAEATTAPDTQKFAMSPPYAAPERWRSERATGATDLYAVGVMGYEMLAGKRPFAGPKIEDYREQHLHEDAPQLDEAPARLESLIEECLFKAPEARPSASNLLTRLAKAADSTHSPGLSKLQQAQQAEVARQAESARAASEAQTERERRSALIEAARHGLQKISEALRTFVQDGAPAVALSESPAGTWVMRINRAEFSLSVLSQLGHSPWGSRATPPAIDVIACASIGVRIPPDQHEYEGRSHSLWYCDAQKVGQYGWYETAFMVTPFIGRRGRQDPFALDPGEEAAQALSSGMAEFQLAWPFTPLEIGHLDDFLDRWGGWFADAAQGKLRHPSSMPERSVGNWRRA